MQSINLPLGAPKRLRWIKRSCPLEPEVDNPTVGKRTLKFIEFVRLNAGIRFPHDSERGMRVSF